MTERVESALALLELAAGELRAAADEGHERSVWAAELRATARCIETVARGIRGWVGR